MPDAKKALTIAVIALLAVYAARKIPPVNALVFG